MMMEPVTMSLVIGCDMFPIVTLPAPSVPPLVLMLPTATPAPKRLTLPPAVVMLPKLRAEVMLPLPVCKFDAASLAISAMFVPFAVMLKAPRLILFPACAVKLPPAKVSVRLVRRLMSTCACKSTDPLVRNPPSIAITET